MSGGVIPKSIWTADGGQCYRIREDPPYRYVMLDRYRDCVNECGTRVRLPDDREWAYAVPVRVPAVGVGRRYLMTAGFRGDGPGAEPAHLDLAESHPDYHGYRHRYRVADYGAEIPVVFPSSDPRVGAGLTSWRVRGSFFDWCRRRGPVPVSFRFDPGDRVCVMLVGHNGEILVPAQ